MITKSKYRIQKLTISIGLLLAVFVTRAQQAFQYTFTLDDGLLQTEIERTCFSNNGELWLKYSSPEFLSRFDGISWMHYSLSDLGFPFSLTYLTQNTHGTWFIAQGLDFMILTCLTNKGQWKKYAYKGPYIALPDFNNGEIEFLDDAYFTYRYNAANDTFIRSKQPAFVLPKEEKITNIYVLNNQYVISARAPNDKKIKYYFGEDFSKMQEFSDTLFYPVFSNKNELRGTFNIGDQLYWHTKDKNQPLDIYLPNGRKGRLADRVFVNYAQRVTLFNSANGLVIQDPAEETLYLYEIDSLGTAHLLISRLRNDYYKSSFSLDKQGNCWYGTSTGLVRTEKSQLTFNEKNTNMVSGLITIGEDNDGLIWMGGYNGLGGFAVFDGKQLHRRSVSNEAVPILPGFLKSKSGSIYFFAESVPGLYTVKNGQLLPVTNFSQFNGYYFLQLYNGKIAMGLNGKGLGIAEEINGKLSSMRLTGKEKGMLLDNVLTVAEDKGGRIWLGRSSQGIALYDPVRDTAKTWLRSTEQPKSIGTMSSCVDEKGTLWLGTNKGLYKLEQADRFDYEKENLFDYIWEVPLPGQDSSMVHFIKNTVDYLIFGTKAGVYFFDKKYTGSRPRIFSLRFGKEMEGQGSEQNAVLLDSKGYLWVGTQQGATRIDLHQLQFDTSLTSIRLVRFQAGDALVKISGDKIGKIPAGKRNIQFWFSASGNSMLKDNLYYDITIVNAGGDTLYSRVSSIEKTVRVDYLPQGEYRLHVTAIKNNVVSGSVDYPFTIPRLLSEKPWFWLLLTSLLLSIPFLWFWFRSRQQKIMLRHQVAFEQSKRERDGLKIQVLSNFFNPHFINNALHWVQSKYRHDSETAVIVGRLAENVDILFSNTQSGKAYHSLVQELEIVKNYIQIQQIRFGRSLTTHFELLMDSMALNEIQIPSMLLQIHTENAVEKGIRNRKEAKKFSLVIEDLKKGFQITIEDDGKGRSQVPDPENTTSTRRSSTLIMQDLISLLNTYNQESITVRYEDYIFKEPTGAAYGTRVVIFLPKDYQYEFSKIKSIGH